MDFDNIKIIKTLGTGMFGTTYLISKDGKKYALKIQHILPKHRKKSFEHGLWREIDLYEYINTLPDDDAKFFTKLHAFEIYDQCKHKQIRPFKLREDDDFSKFAKKLDKSQWCVKFLLDYGGKNTFGHYLVRHSVSPKQMRSFLLQIIKMTLILYDGGYNHGDLHNDNIMINPTKEKYFVINGKKIPYYGYQLSAIDYGEVIHRKFKFKTDWFAAFKKDTKGYIFEELSNNIEHTILNSSKYMYMCRKKKKKMPWELKTDYYNNGLRCIMNKQPDFWKQTTEEYLKIYPDAKPVLDIIETTDGNIAQIIEKYMKNKKRGEQIVIWTLLNKVNAIFQALHPKLFSEYFGWCSYHKPALPAKNVLHILKITNLDDLVNYIINMKLQK